ncbi:MAG: carboxypeptidase regulatory-like domain-containing protein, partial [Bryobacteraceae bacterium]
QGMVPGRAGPGLSPQRIRVVADTPVTGLRYALAPHAVLSGRVLDEEGEPVQDARISVLRRFIDSDAGVQIGSAAAGAQTDDRGHFRVGGLAPGRYLLSARASPPTSPYTENSEKTVFAPVFYPDALEPDLAQWITVGPGEEIADLEFRLRRVAARRITGRVLLEDGSPARGFMVSAYRRNLHVMGEAQGFAALGREPGSFVFNHLPAGEYDLSAQLSDPSNPRGPRISVVRVDVGERDVEDVEIRFQPPFSLHGQVQIEGTDQEAHLAAGSLEVIAIPAGRGGGVSQAAVNNDGTFQMTIRTPGRYRLHAMGEAMHRLYVDSIRTSGGMDVSDGLDLTAGAPEPVLITLRADAAQIIAERPKSGREDQELCQPFRVALMAPAKQDRPPIPLRIEPTTADGRAVLFPVSPGEYLVFGICTSDGSLLYDADKLEWMAANAEKIRVRAGEQKTITVKELVLP